MGPTWVLSAPAGLISASDAVFGVLLSGVTHITKLHVRSIYNFNIYILIMVKVIDHSTWLIEDFGARNMYLRQG